ncbi:MAG TPA: biotin--[acetyl-CoA-carboxylase] ligase [Gemmatimonadaceae bacterium]|nr:biotin--[acetyl-CoA-carboxylase] ligase [Gemmatimonadaceae bacterium]
MSAIPATWEGESGETLARVLDLPRVEVRRSVPSTMDIAHELAGAGAAAGTLVLADEQTAGRGRGGARWHSPAGSGIWMTLIERPNDTRALEVLSIRLGLKAAPVLERHADAPIRLKWPNDVLAGTGKLGGILVESRWRESFVDWAAIGIGVNVERPPGGEGASLRSGTRRLDVLAELVPALRAAARARGALTAAELEAWAARDHAAGRRCRLPVAGRVRGLAADGSLIVERDGATALARTGSLVLEEEP